MFGPSETPIGSESTPAYAALRLAIASMTHFRDFEMDCSSSGALGRLIWQAVSFICNLTLEKCVQVHGAYIANKHDVTGYEQTGMTKELL